MTTFSRWNTYIKERSPLPALMMIAAAAAISPLAFFQNFQPGVLVISLIFTTLIMIQMRLGDEIKDYEKDKIIHPERPLPRGLLSLSEVTKALYGIFGFITLAGLILAGTVSMSGGISLMVTALFAWLMYKEFFIGHALAKEPMTYALTHQVIVFPLYAWPALCYDPNLIQSPLFQGWLVASFGASFTFEICRKLDPNAHQLAGTYAAHYGRPLTIVFIFVFLAVALFGAKMAGIFAWALPAIILTAITLLLYLFKPTLYKAAEGASVLNSLTIMWAPALQWLVNNWGQK